MKLAVMGAGGRMGQALVSTIHEMDGCAVAGGTEQPGGEFVGRDIGEMAGLGTLGIDIVDDPLPLIAKVDGILDFTIPAASTTFAAFAAQARIVHVIGTTGFSKTDEQQIDAAARHATIVKAGNMSLGVNLVTAIVEQVAKALDDSFDIEVVEMHHRHKVDAPSGTALMLGEAAAKGRMVSLEDKAVRARDGITGARKTGNIGFATLRGGSVVGEHTVMFAGEGERIEISHIANDRTIFARGAVKAALWANGKPPGLYSMKNVLGLT
ncbi:MAG: 4-hydroxy-tetrahydrodipicolinate reductase [bacterium]|nr:4-hydroxy-tetrahydrodipicolinate reductase [bacterium]